MKMKQLPKQEQNPRTISFGRLFILEKFTDFHDHLYVDHLS